MITLLPHQHCTFAAPVMHTNNPNQSGLIDPITSFHVYTSYLASELVLMTCFKEYIENCFGAERSSNQASGKRNLMFGIQKKDEGCQLQVLAYDHGLSGSSSYDVLQRHGRCVSMEIIDASRKHSQLMGLFNLRL